MLAIAVGWAIGGGRKPEPALLRAGAVGCTCCAPSSTQSRRGRLFGHVGTELFYMGRFVVADAILAAALRTIVPQGLLAGVANDPVAAIFALMGLAFVLSLCSEADAFVAVSLMSSLYRVSLRSWSLVPSSTPSCRFFMPRASHARSSHRS